ncbi:tape measure protein [Mangrovicoccus sp. HB161399]|uniref:tape measure protein n=1 Tax=Mangrovicoccus sp. HB161399 TaxID=2720392 RepID=UPI001553AA44|nr:tape measure protein [Mangrovicoccus sp. HB161399]
MVTERILTEYTADTRSFDRGARRYASTLTAQERMVNQRLDRIDARWERSQRAIGMVTTALAGLASAAALVEFRNLAEGWRGVERSLASIGETGAGAQQSIVDLALRTRSEIGATAAAVQKMSKSTGDDFETTVRRVETLQKLMSAGGASGAEVSSVGLQLGQALQGGVLSGDEFGTIREAAPVEFLDALAKAAGVTRAELRGVAEAQQLTSDIVLQALDGMAAQADQSFGALAVSGQEAMTVLRTGLTAYVGQLDQSLGATEAVNGAMQWLGEYMAGAGEGAQTLAASLNIVAGAAVSLAGGRGIGAVTSAFRDAAAARRDAVSAAQAEVAAAQREIAIAEERVVKAAMHTRAMQEAGRATSTVERAQRSQAKAVDNLTAAQVRGTAASGALTRAQNRLSLAHRAGAASVRAFNGVMAFFGGPVGLAITLAGALAVAISRIPSEAERAASSLESAQSAVSKFESALNEVARLDGEIASAKDEMARASALYSAAVANEATVAAATASAEVDAINIRIGALNRLRNAQLLLAQASAVDANKGLTDARGMLRANISRTYRGSDEFAERVANDPNFTDAQANAEIDRFTAERDLAIRARMATGAGLDGLSNAEVDYAKILAGAEAVSAKVEILTERMELAQKGSIAGVTATTGAIVETSDNAVTAILDGANLASRKIAELQAQAKTLRDALAGGGLDAKQTAEANEALTSINEQIDRLNGVKGGGNGGSGGKGKDPVQLISEEQVKTLDEAKTLLNGLVQQTQTATEAQEAQAQRIAEARKLLVAAYGAESDQVAMLDEATKRLGQSGEDAGAQLANTFAQVALQAESVEDAIKQIIVQLLQANGVAAFQGLFSGTGGGAGGFFKTLFGFADGGIMTGGGPVPLRRYATGGIANSPQLAIYGEGRLPEAYVPLPDGRTIPVTLRMPGLPGNPSSGQASGGISVQITNQIEAPAGTSDADLAALERRMAAISRAQADALVARLKREGAL